MIIQPTDLVNWLDDIRSADKPFTFSRWGDGEWRSVLNKGSGANCDGHTFFLDMGKQLSQVLQAKPQYRLGMQNFAMRLYGKSIEHYLKQHNLTSLQWYNADVFHYGAIHGKLQEIVAAVATRRVLIVGPSHLKALNGKGLPFWRHLTVPGKNVFLHLKGIHDQIKELLAAATEPVLVSVSASMPAEILLDWLYSDFGHKHTLIDFGSLWDQLVGVKSRAYMRNKR